MHLRIPDPAVPVRLNVFALDPRLALITVEVSMPDVVAIEVVALKIIGGLTNTFTL